MAKEKEKKSRERELEKVEIEPEELRKISQQTALKISKHKKEILQILEVEE